MADSMTAEMLNGPAGPPPAGVTPNLIDPSGIGLSSLIVGLVFVIITTIMLAIRTFTKLYLIKSWNVEDYLIIPAWALEIFYVVECYLLYQHGGGLDMWNLRLSDFLIQLYYVYNIAIIYGFVVGLIKVSILVQILSIFVPHRKVNMALWVTVLSAITIIVTFYAVVSGFAIWQCSPREKAWNTSLPGFCFDSNKLYEATGIFNVVSDFAVLIIPIWPVSRLHMRLGRKLAIISLFATGFFACIASIIRTYYSWILAESSNFSHDLVIVGCWTIAEQGVGIMICCLPVMPRFLQFLGIPWLKSATSVSSQRSLARNYTSKTEHSVTRQMSSLGTINHDGKDADNYTTIDSNSNVQYV